MDTLGRENPFCPSIPSQRIFALLWQLELWMREMVYVELRAHHADWHSAMASIVQDWPPRSQSSDKRLTHMSTTHDSGVSYLSLGQLLTVIKHDDHWPRFQSYFPPKEIFLARMSEVSQVRHRIAHFRDPHATDLERVLLFLTDLDQGFWRFATAYTPQKAADGSVDSVDGYFAETHDRRAVVEMRALDGQWRYASNRREPRLSFDLACSIRPGFESNGSSLVGRSGVVYHAWFNARRSRLLWDSVLKHTEPVHENCIHIRLEQTSIQVFVPSVIGHDRVVSTIDRFLTQCIECSSPGELLDEQRAEEVAAKWPEYVLGPSHPLGCLDADTPCSIFAIA